MKRAVGYFLAFIMAGILFSNTSWADNAAMAQCLNLSSVQNGQDISHAFQYLEDESGKLGINDYGSMSWQQDERQSLSFGYSDSVYWFRLKLCNQTEHAIEKLLTINYPVLDYIDVYSRANAESEWTLLSLGDKLPFKQRVIEHRNFLIPLAVPEQSNLELAIRVKSSSSMQFPSALWDERSFFVEEQWNVIGLGLYYGIMLVMVLYNLFVFLSVRESNYLHYVLYVIGMTGFLGSLQGLSFQFLWPGATNWNDNSIVFFLGSAILFGAIFTRNFLHLKEIPWLNKVFILTSILAFCIILGSEFLPYHLMIRLLIVLAAVSIAIILVISIMRWAQGYTSARYYTVAWSSMLIGGLIMALSKFNIIPRNGFTESFVQIGSALEVILLSFALADRLNEEKRRRSEAQALALQNEKLARKSQEEALEQERYARQAQEKALQHEREAREAQTRALEIQMQATETLERRVKERTEELENVNRRLEFMSITDPLTNVRNRRYFDQIIKREMSRAIRQRESICVLMVDIDFFKKINDTYGHQAGDDVLRAVAQAIGDSVHRSTDLLARYGGEEFILVLPNTAIEGALYVGETVRTSIANLVFDYISPELRITASIGVHGGIPDASVSDEKWTKLADDALYYAKENGRNQVVLHADIPEDKKPQ